MPDSAKCWNTANHKGRVNLRSTSYAHAEYWAGELCKLAWGITSSVFADPVVPYQSSNRLLIR
jgi:hypothetical protein